MDDSERSIIKECNLVPCDDIVRYFKLCIDDSGLEEQKELATKMLKNLGNNKELAFLIFWFAYIRSNSPLCEEMVSKFEIFYKEQIIDDVDAFDVKINELNNYALKMAMRFDFNDDVLSLVIQQGKMDIEGEWLQNLLLEKRIELVRTIWQSDIKIFYSSTCLRRQLIGQTLGKSQATSAASSTQSFNRIKSKTIRRSTVSLKGLPNPMNRANERWTEKCDFKLLIHMCNLLSSPQEEEKTAPAKRAKLLTMAVCMFDVDKHNSKQIVETLFSLDKEDLAIELLESGLLSSDYTIFKLGVYAKKFQFSALFFHLYSNSSSMKSANLHMDLIDFIPEELGKTTIILFFLRRLAQYLSLKTTKSLIKMLETISTDMEVLAEFLEINPNPIKDLILMAELLQILSKRFTTLELSICKLKDRILGLSENLQSKIDEDNLLREVMMERDMENRMLLDIVVKNNFLCLLKNEYIQKVVDDLWEGPYFIDGCFFETSSLKKVLIKPLMTDDYEFYARERKSLKDYDETSFKANFTHFHVWRKYIVSRYFHETMTTVTMLIVVQLLSLMLWWDCRQIRSYKSNEMTQRDSEAFISFRINYPEEYEYFYATGDYSRISNEDNRDVIKAIYKRFNTLKDDAMEMKNIFVFLRILLGFFIFNPIGYSNYIVFAIKKGAGKWHYKIVFDLMFALFSIFVLFYPENFTFFGIEEMFDKPDTAPGGWWGTIFFKRVDYYAQNGRFDFDFFVLVCFNLLFWLRTLLMFSSSKTFGPIIVIFWLCVKGILEYLIVFVVINLILICTAVLVFYEVDQYYTRSFLNFSMFFFTLSLGGDNALEDFYSQETYSSTPNVPYIATAFLLIAQIITVIIFLNLIIALLSNIYEKYHINSIQLFLMEKIKYYNFYITDDHRYDSMVAHSYPSFIIGAFFSYAILFTKNEKIISKLNQISLWIGYGQFFIFYLAYYILGSIVMFPLVYLKIILTKTYQLFITDQQEYYTKFKVLSLMVFIFVGPFLMVYATWIDIVIFVKQCFRTEVPLLVVNEEHGRFYVDRKILKALSTVCSQLRECTAKTKPCQLIYLINEILSGVSPAEIYRICSTGKLRECSNKQECHQNSLDLRKKIERKGFDYMNVEDFIDGFCDSMGNIVINQVHKVLDTAEFLTQIRGFNGCISDKSFGFNFKKSRKRMEKIVDDYLYSSTKERLSLFSALLDQEFGKRRGNKKINYSKIARKNFSSDSSTKTKESDKNTIFRSKTIGAKDKPKNKRVSQFELNVLLTQLKINKQVHKSAVNIEYIVPENIILPLVARADVNACVKEQPESKVNENIQMLERISKMKDHLESKIESVARKQCIELINRIDEISEDIQKMKETDSSCITDKLSNTIPFNQEDEEQVDLKNL